jgi:hypothetical protein
MSANLHSQWLSRAAEDITVARTRLSSFCTNDKLTDTYAQRRFGYIPRR